MLNTLKALFRGEIIALLTPAELTAEQAAAVPASTRFVVLSANPASADELGAAALIPFANLADAWRCISEFAAAGSRSIDADAYLTAAYGADIVTDMPESQASELELLFCGDGPQA